MSNALLIVRYIDVPLLNGPANSVARWMVDRAFASDHRTLISHINANNYYWLSHDPGLRKHLLQVGILLGDGIGLKIGGLMLGHGRLEDLNGTDLFPLVMERGRQRGLRIFLFGGRHNVVHGARLAIETRYPGVEVVGCRNGYFKPGEEHDVVDSIRRSAAHALLVGLGFPRQEEFTLRYHEELDVPLVWNVGGLFDFVSGAKPRAPLVLRRIKLEWFYRFLREPRVMWHRNLVAAPWFLWHAFRTSVTPTRRMSDNQEPDWLRESVAGECVNSWTGEDAPLGIHPSERGTVTCSKSNGPAKEKLQQV